MTTRQVILKFFYPALLKLNNWTGSRSRILVRPAKIYPDKSIYDFAVHRSNGSLINFTSLAGKKILIVNTASDCGYTAQYAELQKLQEKFADTVVIIAFPSNDFNAQEKLDDDAIRSFCTIQYGITFPLMKKGHVISDQVQPLWNWLTDPLQNGWNKQKPEWNFSKYLIDEEGNLIAYFSPGISPLNKKLIKYIN